MSLILKSNEQPMNPISDKPQGIVDIMIDAETIGTEPGCVILSIGAVVFDRYKPWNFVTGQEIAHQKQFFTRISLEDSLERGFFVEAGSLRFWLKQNPLAIENAFKEEESVHVEMALHQFNIWLESVAPLDGDKSVANVWAHGAPFDPPIISAAYKKTGISVPWQFRNLRDTRTAYDMHQTPYKGTSHSVIEDCMAQCEKVCDAFGKAGWHN